MGKLSKYGAIEFRKTVKGYLEKGMSLREIARLTGKGTTTIHFHSKRIRGGFLKCPLCGK